MRCCSVGAANIQATITIWQPSSNGAETAAAWRRAGRWRPMRTASSRRAGPASRRRRGRLHREVGGAALVDAAGVLAIFNAVVRIADATGIPLEERKARLSADFRGALGINDYPAAAGKL